QRTALGGENDVVAAAAVGEPPAEQLLAVPALGSRHAPPGVAVGRVQERAARLDVAVEHRHGLVLGRRRSHDHAAEGELAHLDAGTAQLNGFHAKALLWSTSGVSVSW